MNFTVNVDYKQAIEDFSWSDSLEAPLPVELDEFNMLITEISKKIITASQLRPVLEMMSSKTLSLAETTYLIVQDQDRKASNSMTLSLIQQASTIEKNLLNHTVKRLSEDFIQVASNDLKTITLLFGMQRVHDLAGGILILNLEQTQIEQVESDLAKLKELRNKYDPTALSQVEKDFLQKADREIAEKTELLEALKLSINQAI